LDVAERLATRRTAVKHNVRAPADIEEGVDDLMGDGINIAALVGRDR
jgi:hypothetical protein